MHLTAAPGNLPQLAKVSPLEASVVQRNQRPTSQLHTLNNHTLNEPVWSTSVGLKAVRAPCLQQVAAEVD